MKNTIYSLIILANVVLMSTSCGNQKKQDAEIAKQEEMFKKDFRGILQEHAKIKLDIMRKRLGLNDRDFERFEALYKEYSVELLKLHKNPGKIRRRDMTQEQIKENIFKANDRMREAIDLRETYFYKFNEFMTPGQIDRMYQLEKAIDDQQRVAIRGRLERMGDDKGEGTRENRHSMDVNTERNTERNPERNAKRDSVQ